MGKNLICFITIVMLISINFSFSITTANNPDLLLLNFTTSTDKISEGKEFDLNLKLKNNSDMELEDIYLILDSGASFYPVQSGSTIFLSSSIASGDAINSSIPLKYDGGTNTRITLRFKYVKDGNGIEQNEFITIKAYPTSDNTPSNPVDTTKLTPRIILVEGADIPSGSAGDKLNFKLKVKNSSSYGAKNVSIIPLLEEVEGKPFVIDKMSVAYRVDSIKSNEQKDVDVSIPLSRSAASGTYQLKLKLQYSNSYGDTFDSEERINIKIVSNLIQSKLVPKSIVINPEVVKTGSEAIIAVTIKNEGTEPASDVKASLSGLRGDGISLKGSIDTVYMQELKGGQQKTITYQIKVSPKLETENYGLTLKLDYKDGLNNKCSEENQFFVAVKNDNTSEPQPDIEIENIVNPSGSLTPGKEFSLGLEVKSTGDVDAQNVKVVVSADQGLIMKSLNTRLIGLLEKGTSKKLEFIFSVANDATTKNYPISISVEYENGSLKYSAAQYVGVMVESEVEETQEKTVPKLIISSYSYKPSPIKPGDNFTLTLTVQNTSKNTDVKNVKMVLNAAEGVFIPVESSNTIYIDKIAKGQSVTKEVLLNALPSTTAKMHSISVEMDYEDLKGTEVSAKEGISVSVTIDPRFVIGEITLAPEMYVGQPIPVFLEFFNMGKVVLNNLMVKAEGDFQIQNANYFVGNFEPGRSDSFDVTLVPSKEGESKGNIVFTYEDIEGKSYEAKKEFTINAMAMPDMELMPPIDGEILPGAEEQNFFKKIIKNPVVWGAFIFLAALITAIIITRKVRKRQEEMMLDE